MDGDSPLRFVPNRHTYNPNSFSFNTPVSFIITCKYQSLLKILKGALLAWLWLFCPAVAAELVTETSLSASWAICPVAEYNPPHVFERLRQSPCSFAHH
jgi:hypothetical protein